MRFLIALIFPPLAVIMCGKPIQFFFNLLCCLLCWVPGIIHACFIVQNHMHDKRTNRMVDAMTMAKHH